MTIFLVMSLGNDRAEVSSQKWHPLCSYNYRDIFADMDASIKELELENISRSVRVRLVIVEDDVWKSVFTSWYILSQQFTLTRS